MAAALRLDKAPTSYDPFQTTLSSRDLEIAGDELHENDHTRESALAQMREVIAKHPQIQRCRTDAIFLLRFLRARKFNVIAACEMLERYLASLQTHSEYFQDLDPHQLEPLLQQCLAVPLGVDSKGRLLVVVRVGRFDPKRTPPEEQYRLVRLLLECFIEMEQCQVNGACFILDLLGATVMHFGVWTLPKLKIVTSAQRKTGLFRIKEIHLVHLPKYTVTITNLLASLVSVKLLQRVKFHKTLEDLKEVVDESILPTIYGGKQSLEEANEKFRKLALQERERILKQSEMYIDLSIPAPNSKANAALQSSVVDESVIGSFRKLNVD